MALERSVSVEALWPEGNIPMGTLCLLQMAAAVDTSSVLFGYTMATPRPDELQLDQSE